jgi:glycosyltransferase involved in cell wall biosynthesis
MDEHVRVVNHAVNMGKGVAVKTGVRYASRDYTILLDADKDVNARNMTQYIEALREYNVVIGPRGIQARRTRRRS